MKPKEKRNIYADPFNENYLIGEGELIELTEDYGELQSWDVRINGKVRNYLIKP